jgi:dTDP-glucose 4,6-dehydratase
MNKKNILITGGYGFIGSNFINFLIENYDEFNVMNLDYMGIGSNKNNINKPLSDKQNILHFKWDISEDILSGQEIIDLPFDYLFHFAAESHVDRSISSPTGFVTSNVMGTLQILEMANKLGIKRVIMVSTDEVYGSLSRGSAKESRKYNPSSVYSATKASSELLCNAYVETYGMDIVTTRCANNFGPNQYEEKLIPKVIKNALSDQKIPVYDKGLQIREWVHVNTHIDDLLFVAEYGVGGEVYNVGGGKSMSNIKLVKTILKKLGKSEDLIEFVPNARKGHDFRYSIDTSKLDALKKEHMCKEDYMVVEMIKKDDTHFDLLLDATIKHYS